MNKVDKLRVLLPHWVKHNEEHASEFRAWAAEAGIAEEDILKSADYMSLINQSLESALKKLGGPLQHNHTEFLE